MTFRVHHNVAAIAHFVLDLELFLDRLDDGEDQLVQAVTDHRLELPHIVADHFAEALRALEVGLHVLRGHHFLLGLAPDFCLFRYFSLGGNLDTTPAVLVLRLPIGDRLAHSVVLWQVLAGLVDRRGALIIIIKLHVLVNGCILIELRPHFLDKRPSVRRIDAHLIRMNVNDSGHRLRVGLWSYRLLTQAVVTVRK